MQFGSLLFLFAFLPPAIGLYYLCPRRGKNAVLVLTSLVFYAWGNPATLAPLGFVLAFHYLTGLELEMLVTNGRRTGARVVLGLAVAVDVALLGLYKYSGFVADNLNALLGLRLSAPTLTQPLGLSFLMFTALSYLIDIYRGKAPAERNIWCAAAYLTMFPKLVSGPIVPWAAAAPQLRERQHSLAGVGRGVNQFLVGLGKKVLLANNLGVAFQMVQGLDNCTAAAAWLGCLCYSLQLYFDFSGYSDMAIGLGRMFGFTFDKNFDLPYLSTSVAEFWRRWHISLGAWFREYVYIPLGGNRCGVPRQLLNLAVVWMLTGIWHGADWHFVLWGLYHGCFVALERFVLRGIWPRLPRLLCHVYLILVVMIGWVFFFSPSLGAALTYLGNLFGASGGVDAGALYVLASNLPLLLVGILGCTSLPRRVHRQLAYGQGRMAVAVSVAAYGLMAVACVAYLVSDTYSAFLYAQF